MDQRLRSHLDQYQGTVSARAAGRLGIGPNELRSLLARGLLVRAARGAYVDGALLAAATPEEAHRLRTVAIVLSRHGSLAASHQSAAVVHGLPLMHHARSSVKIRSRLCRDSVSISPSRPRTGRFP